MTRRSSTRGLPRVSVGDAAQSSKTTRSLVTIVTCHSVCLCLPVFSIGPRRLNGQRIQKYLHVPLRQYRYDQWMNSPSDKVEPSRRTSFDRPVCLRKDRPREAFLHEVQIRLCCSFGYDFSQTRQCRYKDFLAAASPTTRKAYEKLA